MRMGSRLSTNHLLGTSCLTQSESGWCWGQAAICWTKATHFILSCVTHVPCVCVARALLCLPPCLLHCSILTSGLPSALCFSPTILTPSPVQGLQGMLVPSGQHFGRQAWRPCWSGTQPLRRMAWPLMQLALMVSPSVLVNRRFKM